MWWSCSCSDCDKLSLRGVPPVISSEMGSFPALHGYISMGGGGGGGYPGSMGLQRSATCGFLQSSHFYPDYKTDYNDHPSLINGRLAITDGKVLDDEDIVQAKLTIHNGKNGDYKQYNGKNGDYNQQHNGKNGDYNQQHNGKNGEYKSVHNGKNGDYNQHNGKNGEYKTVHNGRNVDYNQQDDIGKKSRDYSDDSLTPDSSLPAVIRRRNRNRRKNLATSMVEPPASGGGGGGVVGWEGESAKPPRHRSQSVSDDQWAQMMASTNQTVIPPGPTCPPGHTPADMSAFAGMTPRRNYNTVTTGGRGGTLGRGMVSSASVCDLNSLSQQQQQQQQQQQSFNNTHAANSFQQLNMMGYPGGVMWGAPCELCQAGSMFSGHPNTGGMKRTASNLSMNLSSVGSDVTGYPWAPPPPPPHVHHHMPHMYPGYYPGYHPHMAMPPMGAPMGLNMSIPDSMHTFGKVPSSPAPSVRSTSHRSHKSSKSRSFSAADSSGRRSRNRKAKRSEESEESRSSSGSEGGDDVDDHETHPGHGSLAWQCDHCTFINNGGTRTCGMCSKTIGASGRTSRRGSERRRSDRRRDRRTDHEDDDRDVSEYENDDAGVVKSNLSFNIKDSKRDARTKVSGSNKSKNKKKSRQRSSSASGSGSGSEGEEEERLEKHMRDLKVSSRKRGNNEYDGLNNKDKDKEREKTSRKKEGKLRWKN